MNKQAYDDILKIRTWMKLGKYPHFLHVFTHSYRDGSKFTRINFHLTDRWVGHILINRRNKL